MHATVPSHVPGLAQTPAQAEEEIAGLVQDQQRIHGLENHEFVAFALLCTVGVILFGASLFVVLLAWSLGFAVGFVLVAGMAAAWAWFAFMAVELGRIFQRKIDPHGWRYA